jgi:predicted amidohydrolase YtcJ
MCYDSRVVCGRVYLSCLLALTVVFSVCAIPFTSGTCNNPVVLGDSNIIHEEHHVARNPGHHVTGNSYTEGTLQGSLILYNGSIYTMDKESRVVSVLGIRDGWIVYAGNNLTKAESKTAWELGLTRRINLRRRVAIPGLIDCHNHIVLLGNRPGHHTPLEQAFTLAEVLDTYHRRASAIPRGDFITTIGGFAPLQFQENRLPTLAELDTAVPNHPVFISTGFTGPAVTNSLGKAFFERLPGNTSVSVAVNGSIANGIENGKALLSLRQRLTFADRVRSTRDAMAYAASLGVTTLVSSLTCDLALTVSN